MKMPVLPPDTNPILGALTEQQLTLVMDHSPTDQKGRYWHWDKFRHLTPSEGLSIEQSWLSTKLARRALYKKLPFYDVKGKPFVYALPNDVLRDLHWLERYTAGTIQTSEAITNTQTRNTYLVRSLVEEAIHSSQLEGASTTRDVAKEMLRQNREPNNTSERMIVNNYRAMQFIREVKGEPLTPSMVFELHRLVTDGTLDNPAAAGCFRTEQDDIHVVDAVTQDYLHTPPFAEQLPQRLQSLCDFANRASDDISGDFLYPVVKAIVLHFMLAYDHPFCDGNGRTARALFYWAMANEGYWLLEYVSISEMIKKAPVQYGKAFLYTETDENDATYFLLHQLDVIRKAVDALRSYLDQKVQDINDAQEMLVSNPRLRGKLNFRQLALLRHALTHPRFSYVVQEHQQSHGVSYDVARKDLLMMADTFTLLDKTRRGKQYYFVAPVDLEQRITQK